MPVNLSLHKNTVQKRKRRKLGRTLLSHAKSMACDNDLAGYLIITWDSHAVPNSAWRAEENSPVPSSLLPAYAQSVLTRKLSNLDAEKFLSDDDN